MKVKIGPYLNWFGIYQLVDLLRFVKVSEDTCFSIAQKIDKKFPFINQFFNWIYSKRKRTIRIKLDPWDTWSMDHTLALIIHPMLLQLKNANHGAGFVDLEDVPKELHPQEPLKNPWDTDDNFFKRWDWVMGEMIFAFEQHILDDGSLFQDELVQKRIQNGFRLFGKYYQNLWD